MRDIMMTKSRTGYASGGDPEGWTIRCMTRRACGASVQCWVSSAATVCGPRSTAHTSAPEEGCRGYRGAITAEVTHWLSASAPFKAEEGSTFIGVVSACRVRVPGRPGSIFFFQAEDGIRDDLVTGVQTCALPI